MAKYADSVFVIRNKTSGKFLVVGKANKMGWMKAAYAQRGLSEEFHFEKREYPDHYFDLPRAERETWRDAYDKRETEAKAAWLADHEVIEIDDEGTLSVD